MTAVQEGTGVVPVQRAPFNAETPLAALADPITSVFQFYVRNHFEVPAIDPFGWRLVLDGAVARPLALTLDALRADSPQTLVVTMECAGNGRSALTPRPAGVPWRLGAVGTASFTGVPLRKVLDRAGLAREAVEVVFVGADRGRVADGREEAYARSLPIDVAMHPDTLLAWAMGGEPLTPEHGAPLRLVVPQWYGMASVKWLARITVVTRPFAGFFQRNHYRYLMPGHALDGAPVTKIRVRSVIASPADGAVLPLDEIEIGGTAWSGAGAVSAVAVSTDDGRSWADAELGLALSPYSATPWRLRWCPPAPGEYVLVARATDEAGHVQPLAPMWNQQGYGNNSVHRVRVTVRDAGSPEPEATPRSAPSA
ncbi:MAG TPA: sulfite oxidase [Gemmatimonadales bacterium]|nr:sulfite oxidase [Gemmatimonadales bacterium]